MALKAGRVGVRKDQVDVHGKIKDNSTPYVLPTASASTLGGVKAVAKTEAMTKEVGIGSDGKLYVEPSSGGGVEFGSGTLQSPVTGMLDYFTIGDLCFVFSSIKTNSTMNSYTSINLCNDLPYDNDFDMICPTLDGYNGSTSVPVQLLFDNDMGKFGIRKNTPTSTYNISFISCYIWQNGEANDLVLENMATGISGLSLTKVTTDEYCLIFGNIKPSGITGTDIEICASVPDCDYVIMKSFIGDDSTQTNGVDVFVDSGKLYANIASSSSSYSRIDGAILYKIKKGE